MIPELKRNRRNKQPVDGISESVMTFHKPRSTISEAYRAVRTGLNFGIRGEGHRVIQVTSPDPGDGKSTFTANLAVSLAQTGKCVLLVDADFRRPRVAKIFGVDPSIGLCGAIQGLADFHDVIMPSGVQNLWLMPSGPYPNPSELLGSQRFREVVDMLRDDYDYVLIDTPPVLAVTDPCVVAPRVDGVVLLIRITKDVRPHARRTVESLHELVQTSWASSSTVSAEYVPAPATSLVRSTVTVTPTSRATTIPTRTTTERTITTTPTTNRRRLRKPREGTSSRA